MRREITGRRKGLPSLAQAILKGSQWTKQRIGGWRGREINESGERVVTACALQAGLEAVGKGDYEGLEAVRELWPEVAWVQARCPAEDCPNKTTIDGQVMHLNDQHHWSRERIAAWVGRVLGSHLQVAPRYGAISREGDGSSQQPQSLGQPRQATRYAGRKGVFGR